MRNLGTWYLSNVFIYPFKNRICEHFSINFFKNEESGKMSADSAHVQRTSGGESRNSPVLSGPCSATIDAEYVSIF